MARAPYFDKIALAASSVLQGFEYDDFGRRLEHQLLVVAFDDTAALSSEGRTILGMVVNLAARFYPSMGIRAEGPHAKDFATTLERTALLINPLIDFASQATATHTGTYIIVGNARASVFGASADTFSIYSGSDGWVAELSTEPVQLGKSKLPFGAAASGCLAIAAAFRRAFDDQLPCANATDFSIIFSTRSGNTGITAREEAANAGFSEDVTEIGDVVLVGIGAIGCAVLWTLLRLPGLSGRMHLIDKEVVDPTNPQRYLITGAYDVGRAKVDLVDARHGESESELRRPAATPQALELVRHHVSWGQFLARRDRPWKLPRVLVALDSAKDRMAITAALPGWVANAWTQPNDLGISRHRGIGPGACIACLYVPTSRSPKNEDQLVAEACGLAGEEMLVRQLLYTGVAVGEDLIRRIAGKMGVPAESLMNFASQPLRVFYSEAVCGGIVLRLRAKSENTDQDSAGKPARARVAPAAFQSALAGVLLAAALVAESQGLSAPPDGWKITLDITRPLGTSLLVPIAKHPSGKCLCQDSIIGEAFAERWGEKPADSNATTGSFPSTLGEAALR
jgi:hypothetical protein